MGCTESKPHSFEPIMMIDFTKYYKYIKKKLLIEDFKLEGSDGVSLKKKLCTSYDLSNENGENWISMYTDYMILAGWNVLIGAGVAVYPPYAIQQVLKMHLCDTGNYAALCKIVTENREIVHFTPYSLTAKQTIKRYGTLKEAYNIARHFLKKHVYSNPEFYTDFERLEQADYIWEDFEITLIRCEFNFYFQDKEAKESFEKIITDNADILDMHNQNPEEILRIGRNLRELLGIGELLPSTEEYYKPEIRLVTEKNIPVELRDMSFTCEFVNALAWEQRIAVKEAKKWMKEFKKFLVLVHITDEKSKLNPSEIVNRVWRLYTQFSVGDKKDIRAFMPVYYHSENLEMNKQKKLYSQTLKTYETNFGKPNPNIWPEFQQETQNTGRFASYYLEFVRNCLTKKHGGYMRLQRSFPDWWNFRLPPSSL